MKTVEKEQSIDELLDTLISQNEKLEKIKEVAQELVNEVDDLVYRFDDEVKEVESKDGDDAMFMTSMHISDTEKVKNKLDQLIFEYEVKKTQQ